MTSKYVSVLHDLHSLEVDPVHVLQLLSQLLHLLSALLPNSPSSQTGIQLFFEFRYKVPEQIVQLLGV